MSDHHSILSSDIRGFSVKRFRESLAAGRPLPVAPPSERDIALKNIAVNMTVISSTDEDVIASCRHKYKHVHYFMLCEALNEEINCPSCTKATMTARKARDKIEQDTQHPFALFDGHEPNSKMRDTSSKLRKQFPSATFYYSPIINTLLCVGNVTGIATDARIVNVGPGAARPPARDLVYTEAMARDHRRVGHDVSSCDVNLSLEDYAYTNV